MRTKIGVFFKQNILATKTLEPNRPKEKKFKTLTLKVKR